MINKGEHLTVEGLKDLVNIKASMNRGLSDKLIKEFSNIVPITRPKLIDQNIPDPY
jgi:hypothetical protein